MEALINVYNFELLDYIYLTLFYFMYYFTITKLYILTNLWDYIIATTKKLNDSKL